MLRHLRRYPIRRALMKRTPSQEWQVRLSELPGTGAVPVAANVDWMPPSAAAIATVDAIYVVKDNNAPSNLSVREWHMAMAHPYQARLAGIRLPRPDYTTLGHWPWELIQSAGWSKGFLRLTMEAPVDELPGVTELYLVFMDETHATPWLQAARHLIPPRGV